MHILIYLSAQKYYLTHILHTTKLIKVFFCLSSKKQALLWKFGADLFRWSQETEQNIQFWSQYRVVNSLFDYHTKKTSPVLKVWSRFLDGVEKQNKTYSFEVSIGLLPLFLE